MKRLGVVAHDVPSRPVTQEIASGEVYARAHVTVLAQDEPVQDIVAEALQEGCGVDGSLICEWVFDRTNSEAWAVLADWFIDRPLRILFVIALAWMLVRLLRRLVKKFASEVAERSAGRRAGDDVTFGSLRRKVSIATGRADSTDRATQRAVTLGRLLESLVSIVVWTTAIFIILGEVGISLGPLIASAGIAGIALGFGAQSMVRDFLAGIFVIVEDQYGVGDFIDVAFATGEVVQVGFRTTQLRDVEGVLWTIPNGEIQRVGNYSQVWSRSVFDIGISYNADIDHASRVIKEVLDDLWISGDPDTAIIDEPEVLGVEELAESAVVIRARVKTEPSEQFAVARRVRAAIKKAFDVEGIEIPYNHQVIVVRSESKDGVDG